MKTYRLQLRCNSLTLSAFHADTLFGHLCWVVASHEGPHSLKKFLEPFLAGEPPFVLSEGFPQDLLPRPLSSEFGVRDATKRKEIRKIDFVSLHEFDEIRSGNELTPREYENPFGTMLTHHNTISRLSNTTAMEGGYSACVRHLFLS
jgi:CRISPR-associated protein Csm4